MKMFKKQKWILFIGTFPPRECGIATFTKDLTTSIDNVFSNRVKSKILAMNNNGTTIYNYPKNVIFQVSDADISEYIEIAKRINEIEAIRLIHIQHEFGIFGGEYGSYLIPFLEMLTKPVVVTFHSILPYPNDALKKVVQSIAKRSSKLIVMTDKGVDILKEHYEINDKVVVIPHGIPTVPFISSIKEKKRMGYEDKIILSSFGLLNRGKGYEYIIDALPKVIEQFPNILFLIIGQTHPAVRKNEGEQYRNSLEKRIKELGIQKNVKFYNKYVKLSEIIKYLQATDIYISGGLDPNQITSGTLSYAMGCGRAIISTPFLHAKDIVTPERGLLVKFKDSDSFAEAIIKILSDDKFKKQLELNAYRYTRHMTWPNVALSHKRSYKQFLELSPNKKTILPKIKLSHMRTLTDGFGIMQFANRIIPDISSGYTLDDNARAMIVCCMYYDVFRSEKTLNRAKKYLDFIGYVLQEDGKLFNYVSYDRKIDFERWTDDAHARTLWALGHLISTNSIPEEMKLRAEEIFAKALEVAKTFKHPRSMAFTLIGLCLYNKVILSEQNKMMIKELADNLVSLYEDNATEDWEWFMDCMTYSNSKLPEALYYAYIATNDEKYFDVAEKTLEFLSNTCFENNVFVPVGNQDWHCKGKEKSRFDQQPVDAGSMVQTLLLAYQITKKEEYKQDAVRVFRWFLGKNTLNQVVYDESSGGCHDGINETNINISEGAESTVSYLIARLSLEFTQMNKNIY